MVGDLVTDADEAQRAQDEELIDFFQNAPIALHWLDATGHVIWANQRELDVLGYTQCHRRAIAERQWGHTPFRPKVGIQRQ